MAMETITPGESFSSSNMPVKETVHFGYLVDIKKSLWKGEETKNFTLTFKDKQTGDLKNFFSSGNVRFLVEDGSIVLGRNTDVMYNGKVKTSNGTECNDYTVMQDPDDKIEVSKVVNVAPTNEDEIPF